MDETPRLAADRMLMRLARWLRLLGADVITDPSLSGAELLKVARVEGRILITRDKRLRTAGDVVFVESNAFREQLRELSPQESVITMRCERDRIMQCVLHFETGAAAERVWVTDIVHEWNGQAWLTTKSTYPKLRLSPDALLEIATSAGLNIRFNETLLRQRVIVLTRSDSK